MWGGTPSFHSYDASDAPVGGDSPLDLQRPEADSQSIETDKQRPEADGQSIVTDKQRPEADGHSIVTDKQRPEADGQSIVTDKQRPEADGHSIVTDKQRPEADGQSIVTDKQQPEADGQSIVTDKQQPEADGQSIVTDRDNKDACTFDIKSHTFCVPKKEISPSPDEIPRWEKSEAYRDMMGFITAMNEAVKGKKITDPYPMSQMLTNLVALLDRLDGWIDEFPPFDQPQRFGNTAFRDWFSKLKEDGVDLVRDVVDEQYHPACEEIATYLIESVGNQIRIDYGTGHELSFAAFLLCLYKIGALTEEDAPGLILRVFERYLKLVRRLQQTYRMEPAGSQGVWSLDDHQFLPFIWGSAQFLGQRRILPKSFPNPDMFQSFTKEYMFLGCIKYIDQVKTGPFAEHSNQLWNISGVPKWEKVNSGLVKMYKAEVLAKFPVIQHFLFGSLLSIQPAT